MSRSLKFKYYLQHDGTGNITWFINGLNIIETNGIFLPLRSMIIARCQYTGLKDKNGKEIYEGDIIKNQNEDLRKVVYHENGFQMRCMNDKLDEHNTVWHYTVEIIGNIYENPNLLTV